MRDTKAFLFNNRTSSDTITKFGLKPRKEKDAVYHAIGNYFGRADLKFFAFFGSKEDKNGKSYEFAYQISGKTGSAIF